MPRQPASSASATPGSRRHETPLIKKDLTKAIRQRERIVQSHVDASTCRNYQLTDMCLIFSKDGSSPAMEQCATHE
jgi:hypothetical protein